MSELRERKAIMTKALTLPPFTSASSSLSFTLFLGKGPPPLLIYGTFSCALWPLTHADCRWQVGMAIVISSSSRGESPRRNWNKAISLESAKFKLFMDKWRGFQATKTTLPYFQLLISYLSDMMWLSIIRRRQCTRHRSTCEFQRIARETDRE